MQKVVSNSDRGIASQMPFAPYKLGNKRNEGTRNRNPRMNENHKEGFTRSTLW